MILYLKKEDKRQRKEKLPKRASCAIWTVILYVYKQFINTCVVFILGILKN